MKRVTLVAVAGLVLLAACLLVGPGCSQNNPTESQETTSRLLTQNLDVGLDEFDVSENVWRDDFETYETGSFPSAWTPDGNSNSGGGVIVDDVSRQKAKSLRLFGLITYYQWAAMAYRPLTVSPPFEIRLAVYNGDEELTGPWPGRGFIGLREGFSWQNAYRRLVQFTVDNTIISSGGTAMGEYTSLTWYDLRILYERPTETQVQLTYWIDHVQVHTELLDASPAENNFTNLELTSLQGTAWFDPVMVINRH